MIILKNLVSFCMLIMIAPLPTWSQENCGEIECIRHMMNIEEYQDALYLLDKAKNMTDCQNPAAKDKIAFLTGKCHYRLKNLNQSARAWLNVSPVSEDYEQARFFAAYEQVHLNLRFKGKAILDSLALTNENLK